jgi:nitrogen PTS system EIIA component
MRQTVGGGHESETMQITLQQVAGMMGVPDRTVRRWLKSKSMPVERLDDQFLFNREAVFEWALLNGLPVDPLIVDRLGGPKEWPRLSAALEAGRVLRPAALTLREVLPDLAATLSSPNEFAKVKLLELFGSRPAARFIDFGQGIAIPHPRFPLILGDDETPRFSLCFFEKPLVLDEAQSSRCGVLFALVAPTPHVHQALVAQLAYALRDPGVRWCIKSKAGQGGIVAATQRLDCHTGHNGDSHSSQRSSVWSRFSLWGDGGSQSLHDQRREALDLGTQFEQTG